MYLVSSKAASQANLSFYNIIGVGFLSSTRIVHVLRVLHAARSLRSISILRGLQIVMQTVLYSIPGVALLDGFQLAKAFLTADMANVMCLLLICTFIFAILGNAIFGDDCPQHFFSVELSMLSNTVAMRNMCFKM